MGAACCAPSVRPGWIGSAAKVNEPSAPGANGPVGRVGTVGVGGRTRTKPVFRLFRVRAGVKGGGAFLVVSLSLVFLLGIVVGVLIRYVGLKAWQAVICVLFGFLLADTGLAPLMREAIAAFRDAVN